MRSFNDKNDAPWQAALLDASYGNIILVFSPLHGDGNRQQLLAAENLAEAEQQLAQMDDAQLREALENAEPWDPSAGFH